MFSLKKIHLSRTIKITDKKQQCQDICTILTACCQLNSNLHFIVNGKRNRGYETTAKRGRQLTCDVISRRVNVDIVAMDRQ